MNIKEKYEIRKITNEEGLHIILENHYLHRARPASYSFGLFENNELIGVILYSVPASPTVSAGICGKEERNNVMELARLWIKDDSLKNAESYLIANTIKQVKEDIIISYSEPQHNHRGVVYQATNFIYIGLSAKRTDPKIKGMEDKHNRGLEFGQGKTQNFAELKERFGDDNIKMKRRPRKHRYIYFNCSKGKKKYLLNKLKYKIEPYPKTDFIPEYNKEENDWSQNPERQAPPIETNPLICDICKYTAPDQPTFDSHLTRRFHLEQMD